MRRHSIQPRRDWQKRVEQSGLTYHSRAGSTYWDESAYWELSSEPPALYGRIDLAHDGNHLELLEYNADTPTSLVEAPVTQWCWLQDCFPQADQFNSIHDKLIAKWRDLVPSSRSPFTSASSR